jgi:hypothetical protein
MKDVNALSAFARGDRSSEELRQALLPHVQFSEGEDGSVSVTYSPEYSQEHVCFVRQDVLRVLDRAIDGDRSIEEMSAWANYMTLLDFFDLTDDDPDPDSVWDALSRMAHPDQGDTNESWKLRGLRASL